MKLTKTTDTASKDMPVKPRDITDIFFDMQDKYSNVFIVEIENERFIYRPLGRREWCDLCANKNLSSLEREEVVCGLCTLYPEDYDFSECIAGIPSQLHNEIMKNSYLSLDDMINMISYYRQETNTINSNITCIINEAFPNFDIEEIENWDMDKTIKYFTRAEWKLINLRQIPLDTDILEVIEENRANSQKNSAPEKLEAETSEIVGVNKNNKSPLTPEKLAQLQRAYPEIDWAHDSRYDS